MIQATELRIGNWVEEVFAGGRGQKQVNWLMLQDMCKKTPMFLYEPIPLSPDILEKCGFPKVGRYAIGVGNYIVYRKEKVELLSVADGKYTLAFYGTTIEYLHQLQNLYFALTGKELTLNL